MFSGPFGSICADRGSATPLTLASTSQTQRCRAGAAPWLAMAISLLTTLGAQAENCTLPPNTAVNLATIASSPASVSSMVGSAVVTANTSFLLPSTVFVGGSSGDATNQQSGGVWALGVGGTLNAKTNTSTNAAQSVTGSSAGIACSQKVDETFAGIQIGSDIARLNLNEWNFHLGTTIGYLGTNNNLVGGAATTNLPAGGGPFTSSTQVPFAGIYAAATYKGLFVDGVLRVQDYQTDLSAPGAGLGGQSIDAHGWSFSGAIEYYWQVPDSKWVFEPSAGIIVSSVKVDPFNFTTSPGVGTELSGTLHLNDINSEIGHVGLQVGQNIDAGPVLWMPFAALSVWHEFGPNLTSSFATCSFCALTRTASGPVFTTVSATSATSTFGTYGQYSLGIFAMLKGTGWLGFARVDFRDGPNLQGLSGIGGIRYQFTPESAPKMTNPVKSPTNKAQPAKGVDWTGLYLGGFGGATLGLADWKYLHGEANPHIGGYDWGGDIGYNLQKGRWVLGVEADLERTDTSGGTACGPLVAIPTGPNTVLAGPVFRLTCHASADWMATATARVGYTWERALFYAKAGRAWTEEQFPATCNSRILGLPCTTATPAGAGFKGTNGFTASTNSAGWTIGFGTEFAFTRNWSARAEYDYISFGDKSVTASDATAVNAGMHVSEAKIGVNYRFNVGPLGAN
jgi:outer membrane autotransporter protein